MVLAKEAGLGPRDLAELIAGELEGLAGRRRGGGRRARASSTSPSRRASGARCSRRSCARAPAYGRAAPRPGAPVNVEFVSANPTGPMHVGHCRGAVVGDALASLLSTAGYDVTREYYINDAALRSTSSAGPPSCATARRSGEAIDRSPRGSIPATTSSPSARRSPPTYGRTLLDMPRGALAADRPRCRDRRHDGADPGGPRAPQRLARRLLLRALAADACRHRRPRRSPCCAPRATSTRGACRRPRASATRTGRTASRPCSARRPIGDDVDRPLMKSDGSLHLFRVRHRLPQRQVRPRLRRP